MGRLHTPFISVSDSKVGITSMACRNSQKKYITFWYVISSIRCIRIRNHRSDEQGVYFAGSLVPVHGSEQTFALWMHIQGTVPAESNTHWDVRALTYSTGLFYYQGLFTPSSSWKEVMHRMRHTFHWVLINFSYSLYFRAHISKILRKSQSTVYQVPHSGTSSHNGRWSKRTLEQSSLPRLVDKGLARLGKASSSLARWQLQAESNVIRLSASCWHTNR